MAVGEHAMYDNTNSGTGINVSHIFDIIFFHISNRRKKLDHI